MGCKILLLWLCGSDHRVDIVKQIKVPDTYNCNSRHDAVGWHAADFRNMDIW